MKESLHLLGFPGAFRLNATVPPRFHFWIGSRLPSRPIDSQPAGRIDARGMVEECAGLLDRVLARTWTFEAVGAGLVAGAHRVDRPAE
jgi:hypothetical protein